MSESKSILVKPSVGIDLGTTYSCVAVFQNGRSEVIANSQGSRITPSVVAFSKDGMLVGEGAEVQRKLDPASAIYNSKRFIGRTWDDPIVQKNASNYPFKILQKNNKIQFQADCASKNIKKTFIQTPEEIAATILSKMKKIAEDYLEESVVDVVITVPAYFTDCQRQATKDAGKIAGLNVTRIINEPTAAAMAYGLREGTKEFEGRNILVYDIGGGTFDVSVLEVENDLILVNATGGNTNLGGEDFTTLLVNHFKEEIFRKHSVDVSSDHKAVRRLTGACENLKRNLSAENVTESKIQLDAFLQNGNDFVTTMSKAKFESICQALFNETIKEVEKVLKDAGLKKDDIHEVVLVGGSSRIPKLQSLLSNFFKIDNISNDKILNKSINPDEAVACGAAVQAAIINNDPHASVKDMLLMDVNPLSIGVNLLGGITKVIMERNTTIPVKKIKVFKTTNDNQTSINFKITEGERSMTKDNTIIGAFVINDIPKKKAKEVKIDAVFEIDANGILTVSATVRLTGKKAGITLDASSSGRHSAEEINKLIEEAEKMKIADEAQENRALTLNKLTALCHHIKLVSQDFSETEVGDLLKSTEECISWVKQHPNSHEEHILFRYEDLKHKASLVLTESVKNEPTSRSTHIFRMKNLTATNCIREGIDLLKSSDKGNQVKAVEWFLKAYKLAREKGRLDKMIEAQQHLGHAHRLLMESVPNENSKEKIKSAIRTVSNLSSVLDLEKNHYLQDDKRKVVIQDMEFAVNEFFKMINDFEYEVKFPLLKKFMRALDSSNSIKNSQWVQSVFQSRIKEIELFLMKVEVCIEKGNSKAAQMYVRDLHYPMERAKLYVRNEEEAEKLKEIIGIIQFQSSHVKALNQLDLAEELLDGVGVDDPNAIDKALMALDYLSYAKLLTNGKHEKVFIKASFFEGKIFMDLIMNKEKAKSCFQELVQLSETNDWNADELKEGKLLLKLIQTDIEKDNNLNVTKETLLEELAMELKKLNDADFQMTDEEFCSFLFSEFPPKHKESFKKPEMTTNPLSKKRAYIRLSAFYHPDKVDVSEHGEKYKMLCDQIAKCINGRFSTM